MTKGRLAYRNTKTNIPMPSRMERFGLIISLELTKNISPIYRWFVGTKTLHSSSSSLSFWRGRKKIDQLLNIEIKTGEV